MRRDNAFDAGRSILVGLALDQLRVRSRPIVFGVGVVALLALLGVVASDNVLRLLAVLALLASLFALVVVVVARFLAGRVLRSIAPPADVSGDREAVQEAVGRLALPTGPISGLKFAWGLRDGIDEELAAARDVITTLRERLDG